MLLVGLTLSNIPRTVNSAPYSERETEPQQTEAQLPTEETTVPEIRALEESEPELTEPVIPETEPVISETEPGQVETEQETASEPQENDPSALNATYILTRNIDGEIHMAVMEKEDFFDISNRHKPTPRDEGWICPLVLETYVTSPYGMRWHPVHGTYRMHKGVDLDSDWYDDIVAPRSGTVIATGYSSSAGYYVKIDHGNGFVSEYFHLADYYVYVGQNVKQGELIALVGSTGTSTGAHLHYGMLYEGSYVDPEDYVVFE